MAGKALIPLLVGMMLLTGVCNTLLTKYQDMQCVRNCDSPNPEHRKTFEQPVWQTAQMFVGEMGCWLIVGGAALFRRLFSNPSTAGYEPLSTQSDTADDPATQDTSSSSSISEETPLSKPLTPKDPSRTPLTGLRVLLLALPACCDIAGTTLMNVGLLFVAASIYQMTRGALVLFVGLFSVLFLHRRLSASKWAALVVVVAGVAIVGLAGAIEQRNARVPGDSGPGSAPPRDNPLAHRAMAEEGDDKDAAVVNTLLGIGLIFCAQIFTASQFVLEEAIMHRYSQTPLVLVGWEGTFGLLTTLFLQLILHLTYGRTPRGRGGYFDATAGWHDIMTHRAVAVSSLLIMVSIGGFNLFGVSVTRTLSATSRSTIDTCRTLFIWVISLGLGWESFKWLQILGFAGLVYGTFLFNEIVRPPGIKWLRRWVGAGGEGELLPERSVEHA